MVLIYFVFYFEAELVSAITIAIRLINTTRTEMVNTFLSEDAAQVFPVFFLFLFSSISYYFSAQ